MSKLVISRAVKGTANVCGCGCHRKGATVRHFAPCCGDGMEKRHPNMRCVVCGETIRHGDECVDVYWQDGRIRYAADAIHANCWKSLESSQAMPAQK